MKVWLHGPREGETIRIKSVQFVNGVAEVPKLSVYLERYYNVKDFPPESLKEKPKPKVEKKEVEGTEELRNLVFEKKMKDQVKEDEPLSLVEQMEKLGTWGEMRAFVKEKTGSSVNNKKKAIELLTELENS